MTEQNLDDVRCSVSESRQESPEVVTENLMSWAMCFGYFLTDFICWGMLYSYAVFVGPIMREFGATNSEAGWVGSLACGSHFTFSFITAALYKTFGAAKTTTAGLIISVASLVISSFVKSVSPLYFSFGIGLAFGTNLIYMTAMVHLGTQFNKRASLAFGIGATGAPSGTVAFSPLLTICLAELGIAWTFRLQAGIIMVLSFLVFLYHYGSKNHIRSSKTFWEEAIAPFTNVTLWKNKQYVLLLFGMSIFLFGHFIPHIFIVDMAIQQGAPPVKASLLKSYLGLSSGIGRLFFGVIITVFKLPKGAVYSIVALALGVSHMFIPFAHSYSLLCVYVVFFGAMEGCIAGQQAPLIVEVSGAENAASGIGIILTLASVPLITGPPMTGFIYEATGSYNKAFVIAGGVSILGALIMALGAILAKRRSSALVQDSPQQQQQTS